MKAAIIIPARYGSTRFPGKPLADIGGQSMLSRVVNVAREAAEAGEDVDIIVTTEDQRIADHAQEIGAQCVITGDCATGSDRVLAAAKASGAHYDFVVNLQGDAPFTPSAIVSGLLKLAEMQPDYEVITPVHALSWAELDALRESKKETPFSGTTAILNTDQTRAVWFSKNIIPAIRKEDRNTALSPVFQHLGIYGYRLDALERFCALPQSHYEMLEGLEQLRLLENGIGVNVLKVEVGDGKIQSGIDSPEDLARAEKMLAS